jgi:cell division protein FtsB
MVVVDQIRKRAGKLLASTACALVVAYFAYGTVQGDRGLLAYFAMSQEIDRAQGTYDELRETREALERRVMRLRPDSLDLDLLEERARAVLDYVREGDLVILLNK